MSFSNVFSYVLKKSSRAFLIAFIVSFSIWILINLSKTYQKTVIVNIVYTNPNNNTLIKSTDSIIKVKIQGTGFSLLRKKINNLHYTLSIKKNTKQWILDANNDQFKNLFPKTIDIISISPKTLNFEFVKISEKRVAIKNKINVKTKFGYAITSSSISKDSVKVYGPTNILSDVTYIDTDSIFFNDVFEDLKGRVKLQNPKKETKLDFNSIEYKYTIERFTQGSFVVDVKVKNVPEGKRIKVFPKQITLQFQSPLSTYSTLNEEQFSVFVDYSEVNSSNSLPIYIDYIPESVKNIKLLKNSVTYLLIEQ